MSQSQGIPQEEQGGQLQQEDEAARREAGGELAVHLPEAEGRHLRRGRRREDRELGEGGEHGLQINRKFPNRHL